MTKIYLISPPKIDLLAFSDVLQSALETGLVAAFQLRLKDVEKFEIRKSAAVIAKICQKFACPFILNDDYQLALEVGAQGVHVGENDGVVAKIRSVVPKNFVIGASCYDSRHLAIEAAEQGADYVSFGAFFSSKTKNSRGHPMPEILAWCDEILNVPTVAIGGINDQNCAALVQANADFLAVISYVWDHPNGVVTALNRLQNAISANTKN